jgi:hypothetical protein
MIDEDRQNYGKFFGSISYIPWDSFLKVMFYYWNKK